MEDITYWMGGMDPNNCRNFDGKFVVAGDVEASKLALYALRFSGKGDLIYEEIAHHFTISSSYVLGGGLLYMDDSELIMGGASGEYGPIPIVVAEEFGRLLANGRNVNACPLEGAIYWPKWEPFGFSNPNPGK